jgi:D-alanyl-D-alanine endopeptidase (penicillin-binding protein 7)
MTTAKMDSRTRQGPGRDGRRDYTGAGIAREARLRHHSRPMSKRIPNLVMALALATAPLLAFGEPQTEQTRAAAARQWQQLSDQQLQLKSKAALVVDGFGNELYAKAADQPMPIASITKLMTAMVLLDSGVPLDEPVTITRDDRDLLRLTGSRLHYGATLPRGELLTLALMSSENRAAAALARTFPGGEQEFVRRMNLKAQSLGLEHTQFADATGLDAGNVSTARELARLVRAAHRYPPIREASTRLSAEVRPYRRKGPLRYVNTNRLMRNDAWEIKLSKTGYINEAGRCLVMLSEISGEPLVLVLLNSFGKLTPFGDANRVRKWVEKGVSRAVQVAANQAPPNS